MTPVQKRLRPLMIADFFSGLMFFYPVTFPLMQHLGFTAAQMTAYSAVFAATILVVEVPAGILADRWSRKRVIMFGQVLVIIGALLFATATTLLGFIGGVIFLSSYFAMRSGIQEAMIYDVLLESDQRPQYERQLGKLRAYASAGFVISSLLGTLIATTISFRAPYVISCLSCLAALFFLHRFQEPQLHRKVESEKLPKHIKALLSAVMQHNEMKLLVLTSVLIGVCANYMQEVDPLWPLALGLATIWFGPLNAFLLSSQGMAAPLAKYIVNSSQRALLVAGVLVLAACGLLLQNIFVIVLSEFALLATATTLMIVLSGRIQDQLPSSQRSGVESTVSTLSMLVFLVSLGAFTLILKSASVFAASWVVVGIAVAGAYGVYRTFHKTKVSSESVLISK